MTNLLRILFLLDIFFPTKFTDNGSDQEFEKGEGENHFDHVPYDMVPFVLGVCVYKRAFFFF